MESQGKYKSHKCYKIRQNSRGNRHLLRDGYFSAKMCKNLIINLYRFFYVKKALKGIFWGCGGGWKARGGIKATNAIKSGRIVEEIVIY